MECFQLLVFFTESRHYLRTPRNLPFFLVRYMYVTEDNQSTFWRQMSYSQLKILQLVLKQTAIQMQKSGWRLAKTISGHARVYRFFNKNVIQSIYRIFKLVQVVEHSQKSLFLRFKNAINYPSKLSCTSRKCLLET